ncbi:MAG TPA: DUF6600 domain-containing protein [Rhizomicrobium sp.]|nr:DUF6600 domain-containing protein [Rhizomicrobium sp.]
MRRILQASLVSCALVAGALASTSLPVWAQMDQMDDRENTISFDSFQDQLAPYGYWLYSDRWGVVWQPSQVPYDFRPYYTDGRWIYTDDFGWFWQSDYPWGDIPFHFGRWVNDPDDGWMWLPGFIWSPGWVAWRTNGSYIGWMPLPPDDAFLEGRGDIGVGVSMRFGGFDIGALYSRWYGPAWNERRFAENWVFVPAGYVFAPDFQRVVIRDPGRVINIIRQTRNVTNYTVVNNIVVNRSIDVRLVERAAGHPIPPVRAASIIRRPNLVARVDVGQRVQLRMRELVPRGRGIANSAPPPPPRVVARLSTNVTPRNGRPPVHLFTRASVAAPEAQSRFHGAPVRGPAAGAGDAMTGPGAPGMGAGQGNASGGNGARMRPEQGPPGANAGRGPSGQAGGPAGQGGGAMQTEQPNGPTGPGGGGMQGQQPNGPGGGRMRPERPNSPTGPNGGAAPSEQPSGPSGPTGPGGGRMRPERPNAPTGPSEEQPGGGPRPPGGGAMRPQTPNGVAGPNAGRQPPQQPNGMAGPNGGANPQNNPPNREQQKKKPEAPPQNPPQ